MWLVEELVGPPSKVWSLYPITPINFYIIMCLKLSFKQREKFEKERLNGLHVYEQGT
jgi:hypothetical protein